MTASIFIPTPTEIAAVSALPAPERYAYHVKRVVGWRAAWGLRDGAGWATTADDAGQRSIPLWPARAIAEAAAKADWADMTPTAIRLDDLLDHMLQELTDDGYDVSAFYVEGTGGVAVSAEDHRNHLLRERAGYA